ncbi:MAG: Gfo/Idh/MocA family oxidoreductase [Planctomycetes bacterium]|nr:Gfo/Idh/MocA family oxidoreductase [Planctomycetota bacterium]
MKHNQPSRRSFLKSATSTAALAAGGSLGSLGALRAATPVHQGGGQLKIGIVGVGGRGCGAAVQAILAHKENVLHAAGDAFADRLEGGLDGVLETVTEHGKKEQFQVPPERRFVGLDTLDKVLATGVDGVILTTPPGFRPLQIEKAVAKGVHVFAEKPIASDALGVARVRAACELAKQKGLSVVSGLCYRYHDGRRAIIQRLQEGGIGDILAIQGSYVTGELWSFPRQPQWTELEWQLRNWLYYPWLSGDHIAEQHVHTLDVMAWMKRDVYPIAAVSLGGRQVRTDALFGTVYDHFSTIYEWEDGTRGFSYCRQQNNCFREVNEYVMGTEGQANVFRQTITGKNEWHFADKARDMYQAEHDEMWAAVRAGKPINNGEYMCNSTLMALMGRMAAYTGQRITWQQAMQSQEKLVPDQLTFEDMPPKSEVAMPGKTRFV